MTGWSLKLGRVFGVEIRLHSFWIFLLMLSLVWASALGLNALRGLVMWALLLLAVAVREVARGMGAAWFELDVRSLLLLPTGGLMSYGSPESLARAAEPKVQRTMALVGPLTSVVFGLAVAGMVLTVAPQVNLWSARWVTPEHLLRTMVWVNLLLAAVNLLPAWPLDGGRVMRGQILRAGSMGSGEQDAKGAGQVFGLKMFARIGPAIAIGLVMVGVVTANWWLIMAGFATLLGAQVERQGALLQTGAELVRVGDVMLTEYSILSASSTLEDALDHARHTLQDVFPVVRGGSMVGAVSRESIVVALGETGNGYVQGIMARTFQTATPTDSLMGTLSRVTGQDTASSQLVPVVNGEQIVGILTPQNLQRSMRMLQRRNLQTAIPATEDESD